MVEYLSHAAGSEIFEDRPSLKALRQKVIALPGIKEYMKQRPALHVP
jgi:hypothetical protein